MLSWNFTVINYTCNVNEIMKINIHETVDMYRACLNYQSANLVATIMGLNIKLGNKVCHEN